MDYKTLKDFYEAVEKMSDKGLIAPCDDPESRLIGYCLITDGDYNDDHYCYIGLFDFRSDKDFCLYKDRISSFNERNYADRLNCKFKIKVFDEVLL